MASILEEAQEAIDGDRQEDYGDCRDTCERIAAVWSELVNHNFVPEDVPLLMAGLKLVRESKNAKRDNLVDLAGYAEIRERVLSDKPSRRCLNCGGSGKVFGAWSGTQIPCVACGGSGSI